MKILGVFSILIVLSVAVASPALAQTTRGTEFSISGEYWDPEDGDDNAWGPALGVSIPLGSNNLTFDIKASWFPDLGEDRIGDLAVVPLDMGLSYRHRPDKWEWSASLAATWANANADGDESIPGFVDIDSAWGAYAGVGAAFFVDVKSAIFMNLGYRFLEFDVEGVPTSDKFDASGLAIGLGFKYLLN